MRKVAMVSGASRGIGRAVAERFASQGYDLVLTCARSYPALCGLAKELEGKYGVRCLAFQADMGDYGQVCRVFQEMDRLDVLVNNAGVSYVGLLSEMEVEGRTWILAFIHVNAPFP